MNPIHPFRPIDGIAVAVSPSLTGSKTAVRQGNTIIVSPAMWDLLKNAEGPDELAFLMNNITVVTLPHPLVTVYSHVLPFDLRPSNS